MAAVESGGRGVFPREFMAELRRRTDIVELIATRVALRPAGKELVGLCPFHEEKSPSFSVSREKQVFFCHGCHASGDFVGFVMRLDALDFPEAVAVLAQRAGLELPTLRPLSDQQRQHLGLISELLAICEAAAGYFREQLFRPEGAEAIAYLRGRGVDGPTADAFGLGLAPDGWDGLGQALGRRFPPERLVEAGLRIAREDGSGHYDRFRRRLMFPIWDDRGRVIAFGGRALDPAERAKYLNSPETALFRKRETLYGLHLARTHAQRRQRVIVVEGYMDVLSCHQFGFGETVAALGTGLADEQAGMLARCAESVVLAYDADPAGDHAIERGLSILQRAGARVEVATMPAGKDPDEVLRAAEGPAAFGAAVDGAAPLIQYLVRQAVLRAGPAEASHERRWALASQVVPYLARTGAGTRGAYTEWAARELLIEPRELQRAVDAQAEVGGEHRNSNRWNASRVKAGAGRPQPRSGAEAASASVLAACLQSEGRLLRLAPGLSIHDFAGAAHKALAARLLEVAAAGPAGPGGGRDEGAEAPGLHLLDLAAEPDERALITELLALEVVGEPEQYLPRLREERWRREREAVQLELRRRLAAGEGVASPEVRALMREISELQAKLAGFARGGGDG